jgi:hypothetical protein
MWIQSGSEGGGALCPERRQMETLSSWLRTCARCAGRGSSRTLRPGPGERSPDTPGQEHAGLVVRAECPVRPRFTVLVGSRRDGQRRPAAADCTRAVPWSLMLGNTDAGRRRQCPQPPVRSAVQGSRIAYERGKGASSHHATAANILARCLEAPSSAKVLRSDLRGRRLCRSTRRGGGQPGGMSLGTWLGSNMLQRALT